ncbi:M48 family metalloprotease [Streptomyces sp. NPDC046876]|uniref:M48 family metalloprotease n=1 Tax=Streptomyces sp. NPDC046876 TaxID=3155616 RepID=UPI0033C9A1C7
MLFFGTLMVSAVPYYQWFAEFGSGLLPTVSDCAARYPDLPYPMPDGCDVRVARFAVLWELGAVGLLFLLSTVLYLLYPAWRRRRTRVAPATDHLHVAIGVELPGLAEQMGVPVPELRIRDRITASAVADGRLGRHTVYVDGGLAGRVFRTRPALVRAVIRHELAHLRGGEVHLTRMVVSAWWVFPFLVVLPVLLQAAGKAAQLDGWWLTFTLLHVLPAAAALLLVVYLAVRSVMRSREHQADLASAAHDRGALVDALETLAGKPKPTGLLRYWARFLAAASWHPPKALRIAVVHDPARLSRYDVPDALIAAFAVGLAFAGLESTVRRVTDEAFWPTAVAALVLGILFCGALASWALRATARAARFGGRPPRGLWPALAATAGLLAGQAAAWDLPTLDLSWDDVMAVSPSHGLLLVGVLTGGLVLLFRAAAAAAALWRAGRPSAGPTGAILLALVTAPGFAALLTYWRSLHSSQMSVPRLLSFGYYQLVLFGTPGLLACSALLLAAFVVLGLWAPSTPSAETATGPWQRPAEPRHGRRLVLAAAVAAAVVVLTQLPPFQSWSDVLLPRLRPLDEQQVDLQLMSMLVTVQVAAAVMASWATAARGSAAAGLIGLASGCLAGTAAVTVYWAWQLVGVLFRDEAFDWSSFQDFAGAFVGQGVVAVVPAALVGALAGRLPRPVAALAGRLPGLVAGRRVPSTTSAGTGPVDVPDTLARGTRVWPGVVLALLLALTGAVQVGTALPFPLQ